MIIGTMPMGIIASVGGGAPAYDPGMMSFGGDPDAYFGTGFTPVTSGQASTVVCRFNTGAITGEISEPLYAVRSGGSANWRIVTYVLSDDHSLTDRRGKLHITCDDTSGVRSLQLISLNTVTDSADHFVFVDFNAADGSYTFEVDGVAAADTGHADHIALSSWTAPAGATSSMYLGSQFTFGYFVGDLGYFGYRDVAGLTPTDFYNGGLQDIESILSTVWGGTPAFWNQFAQMDDNKGNAGNMTANGTIPGPA